MVGTWNTKVPIERWTVMVKRVSFQMVMRILLEMGPEAIHVSFSQITYLSACPETWSKAKFIME